MTTSGTTQTICQHCGSPVKRGITWVSGAPYHDECYSHITHPRDQLADLHKRVKALENRLSSPTSDQHRNCQNCVHRDGSDCVLTGFTIHIQRAFPEHPCDENLSGWHPIPPKKSLRQRIYDALWS